MKKDNPAAGQNMIHAAAMMKHCLNSCLKKTLQSGVSVSRSSPVRNESVVVTWEQLSDVWLDKRKLGARCDSALMSVLWVSTTPSVAPQHILCQDHCAVSGSGQGSCGRHGYMLGHTI